MRTGADARPAAAAHTTTDARKNAVLGAYVLAACREAFGSLAALAIRLVKVDCITRA